MSVTKVIVYADGAARGNPGPAAIGVTLQDGTGHTLARISRRLGRTTNNQAEYRAIIAGLEQAVALGAREVMVRSDSELVVNQLNGKYKVKNAALRPLYQEVVQLAGKLNRFSIAYIPRAQNRQADALANEALDNA